MVGVSVSWGLRMNWSRHIWAWVVLVVSVISPPMSAIADSSSSFVLEVVFLDKKEQPVSSISLSMEELMALPVAEFETTTIWSEGKQHFRGVWLSDLMVHLNIAEEDVYLSALNEYLVEFTPDEIVPGGPLVAYERNGTSMSPRDKGPLWVVFPYDQDPKFQTESVFAQSIWQLDRIEVYR